MFYIKQNDTSPAIRVTCLDAADAVVPVTGAAIEFHMTEVGEETAKVNAAGTIIDGAGGIVEYQWVTGDTDTIGKFKGEFQVTFADSTIETFPNNTYTKIKITKELA